MSSLAKVNSALEKFWWGMTVVSLILVAIYCFMDGFDQWAIFLFVPVLTALMALMRRFLRKRLEKSEGERDQKNAQKKA